MKTNLIKSIIFIAIATLVSGCSQFAKTEANFKSNYDNYLSAQMTCVQHDKNVVTLTDSGGKPITISHAAGNCDDINDPIHGGAYVAQMGSSLINAGGTVIGASIGAYQSYKNTKDSNQTRVAIAELDRQIEESRNSVITQAIDSQTQSLNTIAEQNAELSTLLIELANTGEDEETDPVVEPVVDPIEEL